MKQQRGFTLIELMISIAIGTLIIYVAIAGVRVVSQSITKANRYALENSIMRVGMQISLDYTDFWTDRDDPFSTDIADQYLRLTAPDNSRPVKLLRGQAFTPFSTTAATVGYGAQTPTKPTYPITADGRNELPEGWDPNAWHAAAERTWSRVNLGETSPSNTVKSNLQQMQGSYHLISAPGDDGIPAPSHPWQGKQLTGLLLSLGPYGMLDYLPPNVPLVAYAPDPDPNLPTDQATWKIGNEWVGGVGGNFSSYNIGGEYGDGRCGGGRQGVSDVGGFGLPNRDILPKDLTTVTNRKYYLTVSGIGSWHHNNMKAVNGFTQLLKDAENIDEILVENDPISGKISNKPDEWPSLQVNLLRFFREGKFINLNRVIITDPLTGKSMQISFSSMGTTLRGARQQRAKGDAGTAAGWADPFSKTFSPNLDSP